MGFEFAMPLWEQTKLVCSRANLSMWRNTDYVNNKMALHIGSALFNGFSFWNIGNSVADLQLRLFTVFNFIFVAPGVIAQLQPLFLDRRDIYETREKKSKMYSWIAFVTGLIVSELPYLVICAVFYFVCWYYTVGFSGDSGNSPLRHGHVRVRLHRNRTVRRSLRSQRRLRLARQPRHHRNACLLLRCPCPLRADHAFLEILDVLSKSV